MKRMLVIGMVACFCTSAWAQEARKSGSQPNTLTSQEKQEGWILLFDGKTMDQWDVTPALAKVWSVVDGAIKCDASGAGGTLLTKEDFTNFAVKVEFLAHPNVNSGLILRERRPGPRPAAGEKPTPAPGAPGYEVQIRDKNPGHYSGGDYLTGSLVNITHAPEDATIIPGKWNTLEATADGDHFVIVYNGKQVVDTHDSKRTSGPIGLQLAHPEDAREATIAFRNLKVRRLKASEK